MYIYIYICTCLLFLNQYIYIYIYMYWCQFELGTPMRAETVATWSILRRGAARGQTMETRSLCDTRSGQRIYYAQASSCTDAPPGGQ